TIRADAASGDVRAREIEATRFWPADCDGSGSLGDHPRHERTDPMTPQRPAPSEGERASLDDVLTRLYEVISFNEGGEPDWDGMKDVFSRHARITPVTPEGTDHLDLPTFCAMAREMLDAVASIASSGG